MTSSSRRENQIRTCPVTNESQLEIADKTYLSSFTSHKSFFIPLKDLCSPLLNIFCNAMATFGLINIPNLWKNEISSFLHSMPSTDNSCYRCSPNSREQRLPKRNVPAHQQGYSHCFSHTRWVITSLPSISLPPPAATSTRLMFNLVMSTSVCFRPAHNSIDDNHGHVLIGGRNDYWKWNRVARGCRLLMCYLGKFPDI